MFFSQTSNKEALRQSALDKYKLIGSLQEDAYDNITALVGYTCKVPVALITLLDHDRNYIKSNYGDPLQETTRAVSFCSHVVNTNAPIMIVKDARIDSRFTNNPLVQQNKVVFYAGVPLVDSDGFKLGVLCVYDYMPRTLCDEQVNAMHTLSKQVVYLFEQRYQNFKLEQYQKKLKLRNDNLEKFSSVVSHDLKSPLSNIIALTELLEQENDACLTANSKECINYIKESSLVLKDYIDGLLLHYKSDDLLSTKPEQIDVGLLIDEVKLISDSSNLLQINFSTAVQFIYAIKNPLMQILNNLITNAVKYNTKKEKTILDIEVKDTIGFYEFMVKDNADGIAETHIDSVFDLFITANKKDKYGNTGTGIGLATVKKIIDNLNGSISVTSILDVGSIFTFKIPK